ncbi:hypothetical protein D3C75_891490 [compost metagenome]
MYKSKYISSCRLGLKRFADHRCSRLQDIDRIIPFTEIRAHKLGIAIRNNDSFHIDHKHMLQVACILYQSLQLGVNLGLKLIASG